MSDQEKSGANSHESFDAKKLENIRAEQQERLKRDSERSVETNSKERLDEARKEALKQANAMEKERAPDSKKEVPYTERRGPLTRHEKNVSFDATMSAIRTNMSGTSKTFSKFIHNKTVEKVSDVVGGTAARPNAILSGSIFAFIFTLVIYLVARHNGYWLSGSETIASFAIGWIAGLIFDYIRLLVSGKK